MELVRRSTTVHSTQGMIVPQDLTGSNVAWDGRAEWHDCATLVLRDNIVQLRLRQKKKDSIVHFFLGALEKG